MTFQKGKLVEQKSTLFNLEVDKKTNKVTNTKSVEVETAVGIEVAKSGGEVGFTQRVNSSIENEPNSVNGYAKGSIFGFEKKTTENSDTGKTTTTKSFSMSFGAQLILGFEIGINIQRK